MKNTFIISLFLVLLIGCSTKSRNKEEIKNLHIKDSLKIVYQQDSIQKAKIAKEKQILLDSVNKEREKVAIGDINFCINQYNYKIKEKKFLKNCQQENGYYYLGSFRFNMKGVFNSNDSLYCIILEGSGVSITGYNALFSLLKEKYSSPNVNYGLPDLDIKNQFMWDNFRYDIYRRYGDNSHYTTCAKWILGKKRIEIIIKSLPKKWNDLALIIYREDLATNVENKNKKLYELERKKSEIKSKENKEKALNVL